MRISAHDIFKVTTRTITDEGFLIAPRSNIARTGIQTYRAYELGLDGDPMRIIKLYRPPEEVFAPASLASFDGKPITIDHPSVPVNRDNWRDLAVGDAQRIGRNGDFMMADLYVRSADGIDAMDGGKAELSNGYDFELDMTPGVAPDGQAYDGVQRNIRGNHIALVDAARCGSACRVADSQPKTKDNTMPTQKVVVDGIPLEVGDTEAAVINRLVAEREKNINHITQLGIDHAAAIKAKDTEIDTLRKDVMTPAARDAMVADWANTLNEAKRLLPTLATDGKTCMQIRRETLDGVAAANPQSKVLIGAILGGVSAKDADESLVRAAFNAVAANTPAAASTAAQDGATAAAVTDTARALAGAAAANIGAVNVTDGMTGREKMQHRLYNPTA